MHFVSWLTMRFSLLSDLLKHPVATLERLLTCLVRMMSHV